MHEKLWDQILEKLKNEISLPSFQTWFTNTEAEVGTDNTLTVISDNAFQCDWLKNRYGLLISKFVLQTTGTDYKILFRSKEGDLPMELSDYSNTKADPVVDDKKQDNTYLVIDGIEIKDAHANLVKQRLFGEITLAEFLDKAKMISVK